MREVFKQTIVLAVCICTAILSFSSCENEIDQETRGKVPESENTYGQVIFKAPIMTKATYDELGTQFVEGDEIGVYAVARAENKAGVLLEKGNYADNVRYKFVPASNTFVPVNKKETIYRNPVGVLDLYIYYPYNSNVIDGTALPHYVSSIQTSDLNYTKADLMIAQCISYKDGLATLQFKKMMACLEVIVNKRKENEVSGITLKNRDNGSVVEMVSGDVLTIDNPNNIRMKLFSETPTEYHYRAHMPAQTITQGILFAEVTLKSGLVKQYNNATALSLTKGVLTKYDITLQSRINVTAGIGGSVSVTAPDKTGNVYKDGTAIEAKAQSIPGWLFKEWQEFGGTIASDNPYTFVTETSRTIKAVFQRGYFLVGTNLTYPNGQHPRLGGNGCSVTPGRSYVFETKAQLTASPGSGFRFGGWTDGNSSNQRWETAGPSDMTYTAQFLRNSYSVSGSASPSDGGSVSGGGSVLFGDPASLYASSAGGYHFVGWSDGSSSSSITIGEVNSNMSYTAYFEADPVTPPVDPDPTPDPDPDPNPNPPVDPDPENPGGGGDGDPTYCIKCSITGQGTVSGTGCGKANGPYTLTAYPAPGWSSSWTTKQVIVQGQDVNESVVFTKTVKPSPSLSVTAGYRVDVDAPSYDGYTKFYESYVKATLSSAVDYDVIVSGRSILEAPSGETNAVGREPRFTITIQKGTTTGEFILYQHPWIPLKVSVDSFTSNLKTTN